MAVQQAAKVQSKLTCGEMPKAVFAHSLKQTSQSICICVSIISFAKFSPSGTSKTPQIGGGEIIHEVYFLFCAQWQRVRCVFCVKALIMS